MTNKLDNNLNVCAIFMDLTKIFDTVNQKIFFYTLEKCGIRDAAETLIKSSSTKYGLLRCFIILTSDINISVRRAVYYVLHYF